MLTSKFRAVLEEYHRKKWFPDLHPDPFGEFIDYVSKGMIDDLVEAWKKEKRGSYLDVAHYIFQLLPQIQFHEVYSGYHKALLDPVSENITADALSYSIRKESTDERAAELWRNLQQWSDKWEAPLMEWAKVSVQFESQFEGLRTAYAEQLRLPAPKEEHLRNGRDLFAWHLQSRVKAKDYGDVLRYFQLKAWNTAADWNALPALARSIAEAGGVPQLPTFKTAEDGTRQFLYPILPPKRVLLEHGTASGPYDAMRFLVELGKGFFYKGMNPENTAEERICGDPSLPWFWGYLCCSVLADPEGVKTFIGLSAEPMAGDTQFVLQFWYRRELMLALYRTRASGFHQIQEIYASLSENAYPVSPPVFLSLYELCLSGESIFRWIGLLRSQNMIKHLQSNYGRHWFTEKRWTRRARDYWWEGFRLTTSDILSDQQIPESVNDPF